MEDEVSRVEQRVLIVRGPLTGVEATLLEIRALRAIVRCDLSGQTVHVELDLEWTRPLT
jgi:transcription antitermination factor NusG